MGYFRESLDSRGFKVEKLKHFRPLFASSRPRSKLLIVSHLHLPSACAAGDRVCRCCPIQNDQRPQSPSADKSPVLDRFVRSHQLSSHRAQNRITGNWPNLGESTSLVAVLPFLHMLRKRI